MTSENMEFFVSLDDLYDVDIELLKKDMKDAKVSGKPVLTAENDHGVLTLFFETADGISFYNWSAPTGLSKEYKAKTLEGATSRAECLSMYLSTTGMVDAKDAFYGQKDIDQHKLGIDYKVDPFPKAKKAEKKNEKMKESSMGYKEFLNDICDKTCNMIGNEDALFFTQKDHDTFLLKGIALDELDDGTFTPQEMWEVIAHNRGMAKDFKAVDWSNYQLTLKVEDK